MVVTMSPDENEQTGFEEQPQAKYGAQPSGKPQKVPSRHEKLKLGDGGRVVIPAAMREEMGVRPGDTLIAHVRDGELRIRSWLGNLKRIQSELSSLKKPGESVVDEFLAERREEQRRSDERLDRLHDEGVAMKKTVR
jgi:AbrB family looped-hinge helix DNA binding protein